jgi:Zinc carboxypeptidase
MIFLMKLAVAASLVLVAAPFQLGRSIQGRPIVAIRVGDAKGARVLVVGCVHGNECAGIAIINALEHTRTAADLWLVPDLNPDGRAHDTRQNADGVDLYANWSSGWQQGGKPWGFYYGGQHSFSERETRIARNLIERIHPKVTILVPPAHEPGLGLRAEQHCRSFLRPGEPDALLRPSLAGGHGGELAEPPLPARLLVHSRTSCRNADETADRRSGSRRPGAGGSALTAITELDASPQRAGACVLWLAAAAIGLGSYVCAPGCGWTRSL